jgi:hypothetical protein
LSITSSLGLRGLAGQPALAFEMGEKNSRWKRKIDLFSEETLVARNPRTRGRIENFKAQAGKSSK